MNRISTNLFYSTIVLYFFLTIISSKIQSPPRIVKEPIVDELLFQVATQQNENDKPFIIDCEAEGEPAPEYYWMKNGKDYKWQTYDDRISQQPGRGSLTVTSPRDEDFGQYQCFAKNPWGIATSKSIMVVKAELNSFKDEPEAFLEAQEGEPFKLSCHPPTGWPKPNVYWLIQNTDGGIRSINNSRMTLDPEGNLWFSNVTRFDNSDGFTYTCAATSVFRSEYKLGNPVNLNVIQAAGTALQNKYPPTQQYVTRRNEVALLGKKVELFCIYGGTPLPETIWLKDGKQIQPNERVTTGNYGKSLVIRKVLLEDRGKYTCEVSNGVGSPQSYNIELDVMAIPYFTVTPEIVQGAEGETAIIKCEAKGNPEPTIKWIHNGRPLAEAPPNIRRSVTANSITISPLVKNDTGNYGCNATNALGYVYKDVYINVLALAPEITEPPNNVETVDGRTVIIGCKNSGVPKPQVKWTRNLIELTGGRYTILSNGDLQINDVGFTDTGNYTCIATNNYGTANASGTLTVKTHTIITAAPEDYEVVAGSMATFHCNAVADRSLKLDIDWLAKDEPVNFESEPRFVKTNDYSMTITKTIELDSGTYTCLARTNLDQATASATLTVQDKPNAPQLLGITCNKKDAAVKWQPKGDNRAPILRYVIEYNTSFAPDTWSIASDNVPASDQTYIVPMTPWANFTFRVIAMNKIGRSTPSLHSSVCTTQPDVPYKNPENVEAAGTDPSNLVIHWTPMPKIEHNAPGLKYRVYWKQDIPGQDWNTEEITDYTRKELVIGNQPTYHRYKVKIVASNEKGESNVPQQEIIGYSGEDVPQETPQNLTIRNVTGSRSAILSWDPVSPESVKGHFKGYKIQFWTERDGENNVIEEQVGPDTTTAEIKKFIPNSKHFVRILAHNSRFNGPPSPLISFDTPEGVPGPVHGVETEQWGSSAILLSWKQPEQTNGVLTGYEISYQTMTPEGVGLMQYRPAITNPTQTSAKIAALKPGTNYRIYIRATTKAGAGEPFFVEQQTKLPLPEGTLLDKPEFIHQLVATNNIFDTVRVMWSPKLDGNPGSHFYVKYRLKGDTLYEQTQPELDKNFIDIKGLKPGETYEFLLVAVDGEISRPSDPVEVEASSTDPVIRRSENVATTGWFIAMLLALTFLIILLIIVCMVKRNRGGKYIVHESEAARGRHDYPDEPHFHEYSQPLGGKRMGSEKQSPESDTDSMAEYGEGDTEGMNEDGSFIGLYGKKRQGETTSAGFATLV
ncbi:neuroglian isoform X2 [Daktulosphaira vitifoliae]|uniref:neuroglian isoform X2 n=1 Tax=Daktulosphaira vitifoliae TaxID=58002 RepID=UPI0021A978A8|nr:neuroglian isoform X2 [Daktulosphaira vitifoliae]